MLLNLRHKAFWMTLDMDQVYFYSWRYTIAKQGEAFAVKTPCNVLYIHDDSLFVAFTGRWEARQLWVMYRFISIFSFWRILLFTSPPPVHHRHITITRLYRILLCFDVWPKEQGLSKCLMPQTAKHEDSLRSAFQCIFH